MSAVSTIVGVVAASTIAVGAGTVAVVAVTYEPPGPDNARVVKVVDGDTIDVRYDGTEHRIRLLNVDTPETKDPNKAVECLGPEATKFLEQQLEPGDRVRLEFDQERLDKYDRELAGVFEDDVLVNAEIARRGLGVPVLFEPNRLFYDEVVTAYEEGKAAKVGVFDPAMACTFASRVEAYDDRVAAADAESSLESAQEAADEAVKDGDALIALIAAATPGSLAAAGLDAPELKVLRDRVVQLKGDARTTSKDAAARIEAEAKAKAEKKAEAQAKKEEEKRRAEAQRQAEEETEAEAKRQAEADRRAEDEAAAAQRQDDQAAAEEAQREQQAPPAPQPTPTPTPTPTPEASPAPQPAPASEPAPARPGAGYTGCRAYVGGPYIDDQGRAYTPIDCETRLPLVP